PPVEGATEAGAYYQRLAAAGMHYGPAFQGVSRIAADGGAARAELVRTDAVRGDAARFVLHPALLDAVLQTTGGVVLPAAERAGAPFLPVRLGRVVLADATGQALRDADGPLRAEAVARVAAAPAGAAPADLVMDVRLWSGDRCLVSVEDLEL